MAQSKLSPGLGIIIMPVDDIAERYGKRLERIGQEAALKVMIRAMNHEGRKAMTQVRRALAKQTSAKYGMVKDATRFLPASYSSGAIETGIHASGKHLSLKRFGAKQFSYGVRAKVWGRMQQFPGGFMGPRPGTIAPALGGHAYVRTSEARLPIRKMYGPNLANEMVKDQSLDAWNNAVQSIPDRVGHEIAALLKGY